MSFNKLPPAAGAFATPGSSPPVGAQVGAQNDADFFQQLQALGIDPGGLGAQQRAQAPEPVRPKMSGPDPLAQLAQVAQTPPRPRKPGKFIPGKPGKPAMGTAHQLMSDPQVLETLTREIERRMAENPKAKIKGVDIHGMLPGISYPQALTIKRKLDKALGRAMTAGDYANKAAAAAMKG